VTVRILQQCLLVAWLALSSWQSAAGQDYRTTTATRRAAGEPDLYVRVEYGVGDFRFQPATGPSLYRTRLRYDASRFRPVHEYDAATRTLRVGIETLERVRGSKQDPEQHLELALSPEVPAELELAFGAGSAAIELGGMSLRNATVRSGASETRVSFESPNRIACEKLRFEVGAIELRISGLGNSRCASVDLKGGAGHLTLDFGGEWPEGKTMSVRLTVGLGSVTLELPRSIGLSARVERFLASFDRSGLRRRGDRYYSTDYDTAPVRVDLDLTAVLGSVELRWKD
jgi:hypothetical protein